MRINTIKTTDEPSMMRQKLQNNVRNENYDVWAYAPQFNIQKITLCLCYSLCFHSKLVV